MDSLFDLDDPLVAFSSDDGNEMCNSQSSNACVFYSNLFWESAWNDYCAEKNA